MTDDEFYIRYPHVIKGSIELVSKGTIIACSKNHRLTSHGKICVITCSDTNIFTNCIKTRIINVQDVIQVTRCRVCARRQRNIRRRKVK